MAFLKNTISLLAVFCVIPAAFAASSRVGVVTTAASRMSTLRNVGTVTTSSTTSSSASLMGNTECIDAYTECIKGDDVCGSDLEECTTNVLFHGKMPLCFSTLYQCSASGIETLFGTSVINKLSDVPSDGKNKAGDVERYTYPTDGSVLGQLIIGAKISNQYKDSATCVKKYKTCVHKDSVCGEDFELCTTKKDFLKQAPLCDSVLALCPSDGVKALFGDYKRPTKTSQMKDSGGEDKENTVNSWIDDGADLAAANAVNTCYKVVDNCFLSACAKNPYRCVEGTSLATIATADIIGSGETGDTVTSDQNYKAITDKDDVATGEYTNGTLSPSNVKKYFKSACVDTVGTNEYCYMTVHNGDKPKRSDLSDPDNQEDLFSELYSTRKTYINSKLQTLVENFDTKARKTCTETVKSCAMRACGDGSGAVCYNMVYGSGGTESIAVDKGTYTPYTKIKAACSAIVMNDPSCAYLVAKDTGDNTYYYGNTSDATFTTLFGDGTTSFADKYGIVAALNASLASSYNDGAIAKMKQQCENVATNCVKSMCGTDYVNCYRSRTDIKGSVYTGDTNKFNDSMNKLGGVLDYNVILGLCQNTVKNAPACTEHLAITKSRISVNTDKNVWGTTLNDSVGQSWLGSTFTYKSTADMVQSFDANGKRQCLCADSGVIGICADEEGGNTSCTEALMISKEEAYTNQATTTLFTSLLAGIEREAQGLYQAKMIKQRNMCEAENNGGIVGTGDMTSSTFMWVKLNTTKGAVPSDYSTQGLSSKQFVQTNDLYGGFCRIRVDVKSNDIYINEYLGDASVRYFAAGDAFTCGSWITTDKLNTITNKVGEANVKYSKDKKNTIAGWATAVATIGGAVGGGFLTNKLLQKEDSGFAGLLGTAKNKSQANTKKKAESCVENYKTYSKSGTSEAMKIALADSIIKDASAAGVSVSGTEAIFNSINKGFVEDKCSTSQWEDFLKPQVPENGVFVSVVDCGGGKKCAKYKVTTNTKIENTNGTESISTTTTDNQTTGYSEKDCFNSKGDRNYSSSDEKKTAALGTLDAQLAKVARDCETTLNGFDDEDFSDDVEKTRQKKLAGYTAAGTLIGAGVLGGITYKATQDIIDSENDKAKQAAIQEWMNDIGSKIKCYIGSEEVGSYGDIISTEL